MSDKKHIDRIFQERFRDFEAAPPPEVWQRLADRQKNSAATASIPYYRRLQMAGVAAAVAILISIGWFWSRQTDSNFSEPSSIPVVTSTEDSNRLENDLKRSATSKDTAVSPNMVPRNSSISKISNSDASSVIMPTEIVAAETKSTVAKKDKLTSKKTKIVSNSNSTQFSGSKTDSQTLTKGQATSPEVYAKKQSSTNSLVATDHGKVEMQTDANSSKAVRSTKKVSHGRTDSEKSISSKSKVSSEEPNSSGTLPQKNSIASQTSNDAQFRKSISKTEKVSSSVNKPKNDVAKSIEKPTEELLPPSIERPKNWLLNERWSVASHVAPIYYNSLENGSPIDPSLIDNTSKTETTLSYGVQIAYQVTDRIRIRSGVNNVQLNQTTNDITVSPALQSKFFPNLDIRPGSIDTPLEIGDAMETETAFRATSANLDLSDAQNSGFVEPGRGSLEQQLRFIEIPTEVAIAVLDKKIGMHLIGGVSTLILDKNEISLTSPTVSGTIGTTDNLNPISFSGNMGVGLDYKFTQKFLLTLEPIIKYQFNTYSGDTGDFQPYFFGVYTGLSYRF